jgi:exopolyphosphatase / guanosine-5'-triphosphate,3'-diphosphate pyrophosphatase
MQPLAQTYPSEVLSVDQPLQAMLDIGSNATKLAICSFTDNQPCKTIHIDERITRLNRGIDESGNITELAYSRLQEAIGELRKVAENQNARIVGAVGTAALRKAENRREVLNRLKSAHGIQTRILSEREEAAAGFRAVREQQSNMSNRVNGDGYKPLVTFDLGGRSAEMTYGEGLTPDTYISLELGASQLFRLSATSDPPVPAEIDHIRAVVRSQIKTVERPPRDAEVYLIGSTATTLAGYVPMLLAKEYGPDGVDYLNRDIIRDLVEILAKMTVFERKHLPGNPERADIILHGAIALEQVFKYMGFRHAKLSSDGVAVGTMVAEQRGIPLDFERVHVQLPETKFRPLTRYDRLGEVLFALRRSDGSIWLQRKIDYPSGIYRIPGGGVDIGEDVQDAFWREMKEETSASNVRAVPLANLTYSGPDGRVLPFESRLYLVEMGDAIPEPQDTDEGIEDYTPVEPENLHMWISRLEDLTGTMTAWGIFRAAAVRTLMQRLDQFPL